MARLQLIQTAGQAAQRLSLPKSTPKPEAVVRAYCMGGWGDVAAALRIASHLQHSGLQTLIWAPSEEPRRILSLMAPDVVVVAHTDRNNGTHIDVSCPYTDDPNLTSLGPPHVFSEELDWGGKPRNRIAPVYLRTGLQTIAQADGIGDFPQSPMFYRPYREWELPEPEKRAARDLLINSMHTSQSRLSGLEGILGRTDRIAFARFNPYASAEHVMNSRYMQAVRMAAGHYDTNFAVGILCGNELEQHIIAHPLGRSFSIVRSDGEVIGYAPRKPAIIFPGPQPQLTATSMFLSADMPNLVTGHASLSDGIYGLIAMEGQGFFYDCAHWEIITFRETIRILQNHDDAAASSFTTGSTTWEDTVARNGAENTRNEFIGNVAAILAAKHSSSSYAGKMRDAFAAEIQRRYGFSIGRTDKGDNGLYVQRAPFLIQDAVETIIRTLLADHTILKALEEERRAIASTRPAYFS
ncbi:hypothetical protein HYV82_00560 [Candidatus Woesearchaeota archaeon]|nr:hypothetical protein [Candidatus Woesearchaeota archaeon]